MAITIKLGTTTDNVDQVGKTYTEATPSGGVVIEPTSIIDPINPKFIINRDDNYINCNYCEASFLGRKYFAKVSVDTGSRMVVDCTVDSLSSFDLSKCPITVVRNGDIGSPTVIQDNKYPIAPNREKLQQIPISNSNFTANGNSCYVLQVIGGAANVSE